MKNYIDCGNLKFYFNNKIECEELPYMLLELLDDFKDEFGLEYAVIEANSGKYEIIIPNETYYRLITSLYVWGYNGRAR